MAKDLYHDHVKAALILAGWTILDDPYRLKISQGFYYEIDLAAEGVIAAEKGKVRVLIEVKSFARQSDVYEFHSALGQYLIYKTGLEEKNDYSDLYLAVPFDVYNTFFQRPFIDKVLKKYEVKLVTGVRKTALPRIDYAAISSTTFSQFSFL